MESHEVVTLPYLLVVNIPLYRSASGEWWGEPLWLKDLRLHLDGIKSFSLLCPLAPANQPTWERLDTAGITIHTTEQPGRRWIWKLPRIYRQVCRAVDQAAIVHIGVVGWPFPLGWVATVANLRRKRFQLVLVESAPWRIPADGSAPSLRKRFMSRLFEGMARWCVSRSDLLIATQPKYLDFARGRVRTFVNPASWIDEEVVLSDTAAELAWGTKVNRLLYAGRLTADKGVPHLLEAHRSLGGAAPELDIVGDGELRELCNQAAARSAGRLRVLPPVPYGPAFFNLLDQYPALLVPIRSDEQPRVIFDAYARAIPVIGSDAVGTASCVADGRTGWLFPAGDVGGLAALLRRAGEDVERLKVMGLNALKEVRGRTHCQMHRDRVRVIIDSLPAESDATPDGHRG